VAPSDDRGTELNKFCERITFEPIGQVRNHEQVLYGLRYATVARPIGETNPFHEEVGYWLWDPAERQILRCFLVPRGVALIAGGTAEPTDTIFSLVAEAGSTTYGICSNRFLEKEFKTVDDSRQESVSLPGGHTTSHAEPIGSERGLWKFGQCDKW